MKPVVDILLLGQGAREAALAWKLLQSPRTGTLYSAPGNFPGCVCAEGLNALDFESVREFVTAKGIDMVIVGPEDPIVAGIAGALADTDVKVIAPSAACAQLEGSKEFAKEFMFRHAIPTARFMTVQTDTIEEGDNFLNSLHAPYVLKADGLASGKGVLIIDSLPEAQATLHSMLEGMFGESSRTVVIEEYLFGRECSIFVAVDGQDYLILPTAMDHKRLEDGNRGPNTGGMGAVSPAPCASPEFLEKVEKRIIIPTLRGLAEDGLDYRGFLFFGVIDVEGEPMLLEYNVRLGDPESQVILPRMKTDLVDLLEGIADRTLALKKVEADEEECGVAVVLATEGYPSEPVTGDRVEGLDRPLEDGTMIFAGGLRKNEAGEYETAAGRVLTAAAIAPTVAEAREKAYRAAEAIGFRGKTLRKDIAACDSAEQTIPEL